MEGRSRNKGVCFFLLATFLTLSLVIMPWKSFAGDAEMLLDELVNEGVLTKEKAEKIEKKIKEKKEQEQEKAEKEKASEEKAAAKKAKLEKQEAEPEWVKNIPDWIKNPPDWVKRLKFSGDLTLRYDYLKRENVVTSTAPDVTRNRGRFRLRIGVDTQIIDNLTVGFGLASGESANSRSMFQTFNSAFLKKPINVNYAYASYMPFPWLTLSGGKLKTNPIYRADSAGFSPSDLIWDNNITPEGVAVVFNYPSLLNLDTVSLDVFMNNALFILDEASNGREPYMYIFQPGFNVKFMKDFNFKMAAAYYQFNGIKGKPELGYSGTAGIQPTPGDTNTLYTSGPLKGNYVYNYDSFNATTEIGYRTPFRDVIPYVGLFGEYITNLNAHHNDDEYTIGARFGYPNLNKFGDWQLSYCYRRIEQDAELDIFPDANFYQGQTNTKGHKVDAYFTLTKNFLAYFYYVHAVNITGLQPFYKQPEDRFLVFLIFKF